MTSRHPKIHIQSILSKSALVKTKIPGFDYVINPYIGCVFGCKFCYVRKFLDFWQIEEKWGEFLYVKQNLPETLSREIKRKRSGKILMSSSTDPYPPQEKTFKVTHQVLEILSKTDFEITILTRSDLILRDINILERIPRLSIGFSFSTNIERIKRIAEPKSPSIKRRINALRTLKQLGFHIYAFLAPLLPFNVNDFAKEIAPFVDEILIDPINYPRLSRKYFEDNGLGFVFDRRWIRKTVNEIVKRCSQTGKIAINYLDS